MTIRMSMGCLLISVAGAAISGCRGSDVELTNPAVIQRQARITIPKSASNIQCATDSADTAPDAAIYGRFDIPKADLQLVLAGMPTGEIPKPYEGYSNVTSHKMNQSWWQPEELKNKQTTDWSMPGFSVNLLFGESAMDNTVTVYFFNFTM